jgi:hypothetical protein
MGKSLISILGKVKNSIYYYKSSITPIFSYIKRFGYLYTPCVVLILAGISSLLSKELLPSMISVSLCAVGVLATSLTFKFIQVYTIAKDVLSKVDTHVVFQPKNSTPIPSDILDLLDEEDIDPSGQGFH